MALVSLPGGEWPGLYRDAANQGFTVCALYASDIQNCGNTSPDAHALNFVCDDDAGKQPGTVLSCHSGAEDRLIGEGACASVCQFIPERSTSSCINRRTVLV